MDEESRKLAAERADKIAQARRMLDGAEAKGRNLNESENRKFDGLLKEIDDLGGKLSKRLGVDFPLHKDVGFSGVEKHLQESFNDPGMPPDSTILGSSAGSRRRPNEDRSFRGMFGLDREETLDTGGFKDTEEFIRAVAGGRADPRLSDLEQRAMSGKTASEGGFAMPIEFVAEWLDASLEDEIIRPRCQVWSMAWRTREIPGFDATDHSGDGLYGGVIAYWGEEGADLTESDPTLRKIKLEALKLYILTATSNELLADGLGLENQLGDAFTKAIGWKFDYAGLQGTGAGQPLGILNADSLISVSKETGQEANTVLYKNIIKMFSRMAPGCRKNANWIANDTTIPQLLQMNLAVGTAGVHVPVMQQDSGKFYILGKEVLFTEKLPALGSANCIIFADLTQYALGIRQDVTLQKSEHYGFNADKTYFRVILRIDGQPTWESAITPKNGDTQSWAVGLEATE